jgi:hypothetical protein
MLPGWAFGRNGESMTFKDWMAFGRNSTLNRIDDEASGGFRHEKRHVPSTGLVSLNTDKGAEKWAPALEQGHNTWLDDFLLRSGEKKSGANRGIVIEI